MTTYKEAMKVCVRVGTAHAKGDALRAMYARLISDAQGGKAELYYSYLGHWPDDAAVTNEARELLRDRAVAWAVLTGERRAGGGG